MSIGHWSVEGRQIFVNAVKTMGNLIARRKPSQLGLHGLRIEAEVEPLIRGEKDLTVPAKPVDLEGGRFEKLG